MGESKRLFVCTKPFQYMVARLIKQGCGFDACDILILNHFDEADAFSVRARETGVWNQVFFIDDGQIDQHKLQLNPMRKYLFYQAWEDNLPIVFKDISAYSEIFVAHDFVTVEYALIRKFSSEGKKATLYEEGFGNYINNSTHTKWHMRLLKRAAPIMGLPGGYFGSLRWIDSVWLQRPDLVARDENNPLKHKARGLPLSFTQFLEMPEIVEEWYSLYPELRDIDEKVRGRTEISVVLTDPFLDVVPNRREYVDAILSKVVQTVEEEAGSTILFKQHPGELQSIDYTDRMISLLPKKLPIELLYLVITKNGIRKVNLFSFGSTAILNLYDLCKADERLNIFIFESLSMKDDMRLISSRFCELADRYQISFQMV